MMARTPLWVIQDQIGPLVLSGIRPQPIPRGGRVTYIVSPLRTWVRGQVPPNSNAVANGSYSSAPLLVG